jgi:LysM repeat protein
MRRSPATSRRRRPTGIVLGVLIVVFVVAPVLLLVLGGGSEHGRPRATSRATDSTIAPVTRTTSPTPRPPITYTVEPGDTLTAIASQFGVSTAAIVGANQIPSPDNLTEGQRLLIPSPPPLRFVIRPANATAGESVELTLTGAKPAEIAIFEIDAPNGVFTGPPHTASDDGRVTTRYSPALADPAGTYTVIARGNQGTTAQATFQVRAAKP